MMPQAPRDQWTRANFCFLTLPKKTIYPGKKCCVVSLWIVVFFFQENNVGNFRGRQPRRKLDFEEYFFRCLALPTNRKQECLRKDWVTLFAKHGEKNMKMGKSFKHLANWFVKNEFLSLVWTRRGRIVEWSKNPSEERGSGKKQQEGRQHQWRQLCLFWLA